MATFSIFINTTDSFEDCWDPFFTLFKKFWPEYSGKIYLNTETKVYSCDGLNIISIQNNIKTPDRIVTWSQCLINALQMIDDEIILYMQEDYFLKNFVEVESIDTFFFLIFNNSEIGCIYLTDSGIELSPNSYYHKNLSKLVIPQKYLANCQAALWNKQALLSLLVPNENAWQFEDFGSKRAIKSNFLFLGVNQSWVKHNVFEIIPYVFTGIIKGRWFEPVIELFNQNGINVDFHIRGFVKDAPSRSLKTKFLYRIDRFILQIRYWFDSIDV